MMGLAPTLDPARVSEWLGHGITADLLGRMLAVPRLDAACQRVLERRLGPLPDAMSPAAAAALTMDGFALLGLAQRAGAVWHARAILRAIDRAAVRALLNVIGPSLRLVAIRHAGLASPPVPAGTGEDADGPPDPARLADAIASDGLACLAAWCAAQPAAISRRLLLRLPCPVSAEAPRYPHAPAVIDALLAELA